MSAALLLDLKMPDQAVTRNLYVAICNEAICYPSVVYLCITYLFSTSTHLSRSDDIAKDSVRAQVIQDKTCFARHSVMQNAELDQADAVDFQPGWPRGRNLKEEQLANAAESRLLSIVAQLKTVDDGQDRSNTAAQVTSCRAAGLM